MIKGKRLLVLGSLVVATYLFGSSLISHDTPSIDKLYQKISIEELKEEQVTLGRVAPKEGIAYSGTIMGILAPEEKEYYKDQLLKALEGRMTNTYEGEKDGVLSYYGYTPLYDTYYIEASGAKTNMQLVFAEDEVRQVTKVIIALPFYNEPY